MQAQELKNILEAVLLAAGKPLNLNQLNELFSETETPPSKEQLNAALTSLAEDWQARGVELVEVASGWRLQVKQSMAPWVSRLWEEKPARYTRAFLETLALIAYRQPITRAEIEDIRGVSVSSNIIKALQERDWIQVLGHKDTPGRPAMYGTTRQFLDYFNLKSLDQLPTLAELKDLESLYPQLELNSPEEGSTEIQSPDPHPLEDSQELQTDTTPTVKIEIAGSDDSPSMTGEAKIQEKLH